MENIIWESLTDTGTVVQCLLVYNEEKIIGYEIVALKGQYQVVSYMALMENGTPALPDKPQAMFQEEFEASKQIALELADRLEEELKLLEGKNNDKSNS